MLGSKHAGLVAAFSILWAVVSCSSPAPSEGTNTNWIVCKKDDDCAKAGADAFCSDGICNVKLADGGSAKAARISSSASTCTWPAALDNGDGRTSCHADRALVSCTLPGSAESCVTDGPVQCGDATDCQSRCRADEYVATCGGVGPGPVPDPPASCGLGIPNPAGFAYYCCPCGS